MIKIKSSPSLALIKYWGKDHVALNLPATSSLAIGLNDLETETTVSLSREQDCVFVNGIQMPKERYETFFSRIRDQFKKDIHFIVESKVTFPVAAGIASSSSGFAALAYGCCRLLDPQCPIDLISDIARVGSASASRALYSGFTILKKGEKSSHQVYGADHWPELCVLIGITNEGKKTVSSRDAMELSRKTSPYYSKWLEESDLLFQQSLIALANKDLSTLGPLIRQSYLNMFATMLTSNPPVIYWQPESLAIIHACEKMRKEGWNVWETMDAGPQVKVICLEKEREGILEYFKKNVSGVTWIYSKVGGGTFER